MLQYYDRLKQLLRDIYIIYTNISSYYDDGDLFLRYSL